MTEMDLDDETESVRILGIGVGLFLIILVCAYFCHQCLQWSQLKIVSLADSKVPVSSKVMVTKTGVGFDS